MAHHHDGLAAAAAGGGEGGGEEMRWRDVPGPLGNRGILGILFPSIRSAALLFGPSTSLLSSQDGPSNFFGMPLVTSFLLAPVRDVFLSCPSPFSLAIKSES